MATPEEMRQPAARLCFIYYAALAIRAATPSCRHTSSELQEGSSDVDMATNKRGYGARKLLVDGRARSVLMHALAC